MKSSFWQSLIRCKQALLRPSSRRPSLSLRPDIRIQYHSDICYARELTASHGERVTLDAYQLSSSSAKGTVIYLHGGGLSKGSKLHLRGKDVFFNLLGYNFLTCNYPLSAESTGSVIEDQIMALHALDQWVRSELTSLCPVSPSAPVIYLGHSAGSYLLALGLSLGLFYRPNTSFILVDSAAYDLSKRYHAASHNVRDEIERLIGYDPQCAASIDKLITKYSPVESLLRRMPVVPDNANSWTFFATTMKRSSRDSSQTLASVLSHKLHMKTTVKSYPFSHTDISRKIAEPDSEIGRDLARLLGGS